jgi:hypothetical protein
MHRKLNDSCLRRLSGGSFQSRGREEPRGGVHARSPPCNRPHPHTHACTPRDKLYETKLIQKLRRKAGGMDAEKLAAAGGAGVALGAAAADEEDQEDDHVTRLMDSYVKATSVQEQNQDEHM